MGKIQLEHIGIMVHDLEKSLKPYQELLGATLTEMEDINFAGNHVSIGFIPIGEIQLELVSSEQPDGLVNQFLREKGEGIHHLAFEVDDIEAYYKEMKSKGVRFLYEGIRAGSRGSKVFYFEPAEFNGIYIEIIQKDATKKGHGDQ